MGASKLSRNDWINAAMNVLSTGGIELVRIDNIAKKLKITRGSFYYHFKNRQELLQAILENWRVKATEAVIENLQKRSLDPLQQLTELVTLPHRGKRSIEAASIEISLRTWARRDPIAKAAVEEVDSYRIAYIERLFVEMDHSKQQAEDIAHLLYSYMVAASLMINNDSTVDQANRARRLAIFLSENCPINDCKQRANSNVKIQELIR